MRKLLLTAIVFGIMFLCAHAQESSSIIDKIADFPNKLFSRLDKKTAELDRQLDKQTEKYLDKLAREERKLKERLYKTDSAKAAALFANDPEGQYQQFIQKIKNEGSADIHSMGSEYLPYADSLNVSLSFLNKNPQLLDNTKIVPADIENTLTQVKQLQAKLLDADAIKAYVQQRKEQLKQALTGELSNSDTYGSYSKGLYYYSQQVREYREAFNDPGKLLKKALELLNRLPAFSSFMKQNSFLAGLFSVPGDYGSADALTGMQTRDQVLAMMQNQIGQGGPNAASTIQNSLQSASQDIQNIQNKVSSLGGGNGSMDMPNFKPRQQKTKTFLQRIEYGVNIQTQHAAYYFPTTTDIGLSIGYKLSANNTIGIGTSYKIGWGQDIQHVHFTSQGASIRSFVDIRARKNFFFSGGFEYNYQPIDGQHLNNLNSWQQSGLIGISRIVSMNTKVFKKTKLQFLWDFLSYRQIPNRGQPFKFRVGYNF
ncbi:MAG TPA: hypothetical protein VG890_15425 [Puia sp.]|nr:hypothetical protein [Puia sp.]